MKVEDLVGGINDPIFGGTPEGKIFDPLGLGQDESALYRRRVVEVKHGRVCMVAFLGMTVGPNDLVTPTHALLSPSQDLHFDDIPGGVAAIQAVPIAGWIQIFALVGLHELTIAKQDYTKAPGEIPTFLGFKPEDPAEFKVKQLKELKNGRLAMIAVLGEMMAQQVRLRPSSRPSMRACLLALAHAAARQADAAELRAAQELPLAELALEASRHGWLAAARLLSTTHDC